MKILITGGHLTPALAVINKLPKDVQVVYVGRKHALQGDSAISLEYQTIEEMGISFITFQPGRLQRKFTRYSIASLSKVPADVAKAWKILKEEKPDVILSFGGHVALPFGIASSFLRIPLVIHEQTLEAGVTNKILSRFASKICISWESSAKFFPQRKVILTGNPIVPSSPSKDIQETLKRIPKKYPILTITGGSLGSHPINVLIEPILEKLIAKYTVIHQTGDAKEYGDFQRLEAFRDSIPYTFQERYILKKFIPPSDMNLLYSSSDVVVSRSGMNTVLTLLLVNTPAILIPLPFAQRGEQLKNALLLKDTGLGEVILQEKATLENLFTAINQMMENRKTFSNKDHMNMQKLHANAAEKIVKIVYETAQRLQKKN